MTSPALRVFISYARRDGDAFAQELLAGLEVAGFDAFLDKQDIAAGEDWEARLSGLIQAADTVVYVITPASVASERCAQEVALAQRASKRIIPVVAIDAPEADAPPALARLNYIYFSEGHSFARALSQLAQALRVDVDWIREHTRLGDAAVRWRDRDKSELLLLRGAELSAAQNWLTAWKAGAPEPTDLHRLYIQEGAAAEERRLNTERQQLAALTEAQAARELAFKRLSRRTTLGLIGLGGLVAVAAGAATIALGEREARRSAEQRSVEALIAREAARVDVAGQITLVSGIVRQGRSAEDAPSAYSDIFIDDIAAPDMSLLQAAERTNQRGDFAMRPQLVSDLNGGLYFGRSSPVARRAIVVSISHIGERSFAAPAQDAARWGAKFETLGFAVTRLADPNATQFLDALRTQSPTSALSVLYFAGGGVVMDSDEYLLMAGTTFATREEVQTTALDLRVVKQTMSGAAQASVLILDTSFLDFRLAAI